MSKELELVRLEIEDGVGIITIARPEAANSLNLPLAKSFRSIVYECERNSAVKVILVRSEGRFFCAGGDVTAFGQAGLDMPQLIRDLTNDLHPALSKLTEMPKPVICAVQGATAGAGVGIALAGDIVIAAQSAHFTLAYSAIGLSPDAGATWILPRLVGVRRALEIALLNRRISAAEALDMGLITKLVPDSDLQAIAYDTARHLANGAARALGMTKKLIRDGLEASFDEQLEAEAIAIGELSKTSEGREGVAAFLEKRRPSF